MAGGMQVELLLTLEEYCEDAGGDDNAHGACFEAVFQQVPSSLHSQAACYFHLARQVFVLLAED